jgi:hypothetical protein
MAVETIVRNTLAGRAPPPGARPATRELELDDYRKAFIGRTIYCGERCDATRSDEPLYRRILGEAWTQLPQSLRGMHGSQAEEAGTSGAIVRARGRRVLPLSCRNRGSVRRTDRQLLGLLETGAEGLGSFNRIKRPA